MRERRKLADGKGNGGGNRIFFSATTTPYNPLERKRERGCQHFPRRLTSLQSVNDCRARATVALFFCQSPPPAASAFPVVYLHYTNNNISIVQIGVRGWGEMGGHCGALCLSHLPMQSLCRLMLLLSFVPSDRLIERNFNKTAVPFCWKLPFNANPLNQTN